MPCANLPRSPSAWQGSQLERLSTSRSSVVADRDVDTEAMQEAVSTTDEVAGAQQTAQQLQHNVGKGRNAYM